MEADSRTVPLLPKRTRDAAGLGQKGPLSVTVLNWGSTVWLAGRVDRRNRVPVCVTMTAMARFLILCVITAASLSAADYRLKAGPETLAWGYYWAGAKPVLTIKSGDVVEIQTVSGNPQTLERAGLPADQIQPELRQVYAGVPAENRGPGGHLLTGPVAIEGAQPGDVLEVRIRSIRLDVPYAYNSAGRNGFLADVFPEVRTKIIPLDRKGMIAHFGGGIDYFIESVFNYPTLSDVYKYAAFDALAQLNKLRGDAPAAPVAPQSGKELATEAQRAQRE